MCRGPEKRRDKGIAFREDRATPDGFGVSNDRSRDYCRYLGAFFNPSMKSLLLLLCCTWAGLLSAQEKAPVRHRLAVLLAPQLSYFAGPGSINLTGQRP